MFRKHSKSPSATSSATSSAHSGGSGGLNGNVGNNGSAHYPTTYSGSRVGVFLLGATYMDTILHVNHFPIEDTKQRAQHVEHRRGGNAANTAEVVGQDPKAKVWYMSSLPSVSASKSLLKELHGSNVRTDICVFHPSHSSPPQAYIISSAESNSRTIISHSTLPDLTLEDFIKKFDMAFVKNNSDIVSNNKPPFTWIHFEGRGVETGGMIDYVEKVYIRHGWRQKLTISVEFEKGDRPGIQALLQQADVCFFSRLYAETLGFHRPEEFLANIGKSCKPSATTFCCWGDRGAVALHLESGRSFTSGAGRVEMIMDTVGAGDTFVAGIILGLGVRGLDIARGLKFACGLASQKCTQYGFKDLLSNLPPDM
ncbi:hypothetical protein BGZ83_001304 [Gryganskiella cystojenkinii]|nr:hypothetical protein BGZ83_001304 [Gryganskiella cystojenkinii]